jgi:16S rRNA (cytosine967-C5)-methyltransferase
LPPLQAASVKAKVSGARERAVKTLLAGGGPAAVDAALREPGLDARERHFFTQLVYGSLKMQRALDWSLAGVLTRPVDALDELARWVLRVGAYQLLYLDRVPQHSAVDESVTVARRLGHRGMASLANAVLRKLAARPQRPPVPSGPDDIQAFCVWASLPDWLGRHLIHRFGFETAMRIAQGVNQPAKRAVRVTTGRADVREIHEKLHQADINAAAGRYGIPECLVLKDVPAGAGASLQRMINAGLVTMQSEESQLAVQILAPHPGELVFDICAGRGVKTGALAGRGPSRIVAIDDNEASLAILRADMVRLGWTNVEIVRADATRPYPAGLEQADAVLVDAPCTGIGTIGRRAELRWKKGPDDGARLALVQARILDVATQHVRPGGRLLYVTCSTDPREDEEVVVPFLSRNPGWRAEPVLPLIRAGIRLGMEGDFDGGTAAPEDGVLQLGDFALTIPGIDGADGFFFALLRRGSAAP